MLVSHKNIFVQKVVDSFYDLFVRMWEKDFVPPLVLANTPAPPHSGIDVRAARAHGPEVIHR